MNELDKINFKGAGGRLPGLALLLPPLALGLVFGLSIWGWYWWRIEPRNGELAVLMRKTGAPLGEGEVVASRPGQQGAQLEVLPEGRYFRNPFTWDWKIHPLTDIPAGRLGVRVRLYGKDLPPGEILAKEGYKGIETDILAPGKYRVNPCAHQVLVFDAIQVRPGNIGVKTRLVGKDILGAKPPESSRDSYLVGEGDKGVCPEVLAPGTYYLNPYFWAVVELNLQSQRFEMSGDDVIQFLTSDGFTVRVEGTIEFNVRREMAALLTHKVGDMDDIVKKLILPRARGFFRVEGSKKTAVEFIVGETRQQFQDALELHLKKTCAEFGVSVNSVLIRNIIPPNDVSAIIRDRELAGQVAKTIEQQIAQAKSQAELAKQETLALRSAKKVEADTAKLRAEIEAKQDQAVKMTGAERELEVAKIERQAAEAQAKAVVLAAEAERDVIRLQNQADAEVLKTKAAAFGDGMGWARHNLHQALAPRLKSVMANDVSAKEWLPSGGPSAGKGVAK